MEALWNDILEYGGPMGLLIIGFLFVLWRAVKFFLKWAFDDEKGYFSRAITAHLDMVEKTLRAMDTQHEALVQQARNMKKILDGVAVIQEKEEALLRLHMDEREGTRFETVSLKRLARKLVKRLPGMLSDLGMDNKLAKEHAEAIGNDFVKTAS